MADEGLRFPTSIGTSDASTIHLLGHDLATDLIGRVGFGELAFWLVAGRRPAPGEVRVFEAVLVALADHGFTPTAIGSSDESTIHLLGQDLAADLMGQVVPAVVVGRKRVHGGQGGGEEPSAVLGDAEEAGAAAEQPGGQRALHRLGRTGEGEPGRDR